MTEPHAEFNFGFVTLFASSRRQTTRSRAPSVWSEVSLSDVASPMMWGQLLGVQIRSNLAKYFTGELTRTRLVTLMRSGQKDALDRTVQVSQVERGSEKRQKTQSPMVYLPHLSALLQALLPSLPSHHLTHPASKSYYHRTFSHSNSSTLRFRSTFNCI